MACVLLGMIFKAFHRKEKKKKHIYIQLKAGNITVIHYYCIMKVKMNEDKGNTCKNAKSRAAFGKLQHTELPQKCHVHVGHVLCCGRFWPFSSHHCVRSKFESGFKFFWNNIWSEELYQVSGTIINRKPKTSEYSLPSRYHTVYVQFLSLGQTFKFVLAAGTRFWIIRHYTLKIILWVPNTIKTFWDRLIMS